MDGPLAMACSLVVGSVFGRGRDENDFDVRTAQNIDGAHDLAVLDLRLSIHEYNSLNPGAKGPTNYCWQVLERDFPRAEVNTMLVTDEDHRRLPCAVDPWSILGDLNLQSNVTLHMEVRVEQHCYGHG